MIEEPVDVPPAEPTAAQPPGSPCTNCGKCCTAPSYMATLSATGDDVKRWRREGRQDILRFADVLGPRSDPWADLWIDDQTGNERLRCPFVRKVRGQNRYLCTIYETRPQVCRDYTPWAPGTICEVVEPVAETQRLPKQRGENVGREPGKPQKS